MSGFRLTKRPQAVNFFAMEITDTSGDLARAANDNTCPYCGGVLEPGDKASDCSGSKSSTRSSAQAWPMIPFPKGWEASC